MFWKIWERERKNIPKIQEIEDKWCLFSLSLTEVTVKREEREREEKQEKEAEKEPKDGEWVNVATYGTTWIWEPEKMRRGKISLPTVNGWRVKNGKKTGMEPTKIKERERKRWWWWWCKEEEEKRGFWVTFPTATLDNLSTILLIPYSAWKRGKEEEGERNMMFITTS